MTNGNYAFGPSAGRSGFIEIMSKLKSWRIGSVSLLSLVTFFWLAGVPGTSAQQAKSGSPGVAVRKATLSMTAVAAMQQLPGWTNYLNSPQTEAPLPLLPRGMTNNPGGGEGFAAASQSLITAASGGTIRTSPPPAVSFQALPDNLVTIPPDTHGAVGPNHVMTVLNSQVRIQDRSGNVLSTVSLPLFWFSLGVTDVFDPKVLYDHGSGRWIFVAVAERLSPVSGVVLAVSQTSDPTGNWFRYLLDGDVNDLLWVDYPSVGFNKDWIAVSVNMFTIFPVFFDRTHIYVVDKADVYANGAGRFTLLEEPNGFTMVPAVTHDQNLSTIYVVDDPATSLISTGLRVSTITGPVGAEQLTLATGSVNPQTQWNYRQPFSAGSMPQLGTTALIMANDARVQNVVYRNGSLWATHTAFLPAANPTYAVAQWYQFDTLGQILQFGQVGDANGIVSHAFPSIAVNSVNDVLIGFTRFSPTEYASAAYAFRFSSDPTNTMQADRVLKAGEGPYSKAGRDPRVRWGDYSSTVVDPVNDLDMWTIQEYAASPLGTLSVWGTWWGMVSASGGVRFDLPAYSVNEAPPPGFVNITVVNAEGTAGTVEWAITGGTAVSGVDYVGPTGGLLTFTNGQTSTFFTISPQNNFDVNTDKTIEFTLSNPQGGTALGYLTNAVLTIIDDESAAIVSPAGEFNFSSWIDSAGTGLPYLVTMDETDFTPFCYPGYFIDRGRSALGALITVVRTNGSTGKVMVDYRTVDTGSADPFCDYTPVSGTLVFDDFQNSTNFVVPLRNLDSYLTNDCFFSSFFLNSNFFRFINIELSNPRPAPEEEAERPGLIRPTLGAGSTSAILAYDVGLGLPTFTGTTNITPTFINAFGFERLHYRFDEHPGRDPRTPGGQNVVEISVLLPLGGPSSVRVTTFNHVRGLGLWGINNFPFGNLVGSSLSLGGSYTVDAGSDFASDPVGGSEILANPIYTDPALSTITNLSDYVARSFVLTMGCRSEFTIAIENDSAVEFNEDIIVFLTAIGGNPPVNPYAAICNVSILYKDQPAGAVDREWNPDNVEGTPDRSYNRTPGANNIVNAVVVQPADGKTVLAGDFTAVNTKPRNRIARMNPDGSLDNTFTPGTGADGSITTLALYPASSIIAGRIIVGGAFSSYNGSARNGVARLLPNGQLDPTFVVGNGANGTVRSMALLPDGKLLIAGDFTEYNDFSRNGIARLNSDGSIDTAFDPGSGADSIIWSIAVGPAVAGGNKVLIGGDFQSYQGEFRGGIAQLNPNGSLDTGFDPGGGANSSVYAIARQTDGMVLIAGAFNEIDARRRVGIARLNPDGSLETSFDSGNGPNNPIYALTLDANQKAIVGGPFTSYNGTRRMGLARLRYDGTVDTSFLDTAYNQFAGLVNAFSFEPPNYVNSIAVQPDGNIMLGGSFKSIGGNPSFTADVPNQYQRFTRSDKRVRYNIARVLGGATPGPGNTEFEVDDYTVDENGGIASLKLQRVDGRLGTVYAIAGTADRTASVDRDFVNTNLFTLWGEAFYQTNLNLTFPILFPDNFAPISVGKVDPIYLDVHLLDDVLREGDESVDLSFLRPEGQITLGGDVIPLGAALGRSKARLNILDNDFDAGTLVFQTPTIFTNENALRATITVVRTNGANGVASVDYFTTSETAAPRATAGTGPGGDYSAASGRLTFASGQTIATFTVTIINDTAVEFDENIGLVLTNASGAKLPGGTAASFSTAVLTIVDNDFPPGRLNFAATSFANNESEGVATVRVTRTGGNSGAITVGYRTFAGTALSPADFVSTNGTLTWNDGDSVSKVIFVPLVADGLPEGSESFTIRLSDGRVGGIANTNLLGLRTNSTVVIEDGDAYGNVAFGQSFYQADESGGVATISVIRSGGIAGTGTVSFATIPGTGIIGTDYLTTNGILTFLPGEISKTFGVPLLDDAESDGNKVVLLSLSGAVNVTLGTPSQVALTIIDNRSFNEPAGALDTLFGGDVQANGPIYSMALQATNGLTDGRIVVAGDFTDFNQVVRNRLARLLPNGSLDTTFDPGPGANDTIRAIAMQADGRLVMGGFFTQVLSTNRNRIARLNIDGSLDGSFNPGAGADNPVYALAVQPNGRILVAGAFSTFNSISRPGIVRLNTNGTVDFSFNVGSGADGPVYAVALQSDGKVLIGGDFSSVDGVTRGRIARLNSNGSLDLTFDPGDGVNDAVRAILFASDGGVIIGGSFTSVNGTARNHIARLNADGSVDSAFLSGVDGANNSIFALALQVDGKILAAGDFTRFNGVTRNRLTRLNSDGSNDPTINFGAGADAFVSSLLIQPDRKIILGGGFSSYDSVPRLRVARIHGGAIFGPGSLEFTQPQYLVSEGATNGVVVVRRRGGTVGPVSVDFLTTDDTARAAIDYVTSTGTLTFPEAETFVSFAVPIINNFIPDGDRSLGLQLVNGTYGGGAVPGAQPFATMRILDDEGVVGFSSGNFSVNEGVESQIKAITVVRSGTTNGLVSVKFATSFGGTAAVGVDYRSTNGTLTFLPGETTKSFHVRIFDDTLGEGTETVLMTLTEPSNSNTLGIATATLAITDNEFAPGQFIMGATSYSIAENATNALVTIVRTNGSSGLATVTYRTIDGTAIGSVDYIATNQVLAFADGETIKVVSIGLNDDLLVEVPETFQVALSLPTGGTTLGSITNVPVTIVDNDVSLIIPAGSSLLDESLTVNGIIDPGETVTLSFSLRNIGSGNTSNLVATLLPVSGVVAPSAPQSYGVLLANGAADARTFSFTASGSVGDRLQAVLQLTDGAVTNGFATFAFTIGGQAVRTFANTNRIVINDNTMAAPYPSTISVVNMGGTVTRLTVTLTNFAHAWPEDVDVLLIGPAGQRVMLMSDAGKGHAVTNLTMSFSDTATNTLPQLSQLLARTYVPGNYAAPGENASDTFLPPVPQPTTNAFPFTMFPYTNTALSVFNDISPNGTWSLYVVDDTAFEVGSIGGWSLNIQTADPVSPSSGVSVADLAVTASVASASVAVGANSTTTLTVTNRGPAAALNAALLDQMAPGLTLVSATPSMGSWNKIQNTLTWMIGTLPSGGSASITLVTRPQALGSFTSVATVSANQTDLNAANDSVTLSTTGVSVPALTISRLNNVLSLSWPANSGFKLQVADTLVPANWGDVGTAPQVNGSGQNVVSVGVAGNSKFYRLRAP